MQPSNLEDSGLRTQDTGHRGCKDAGHRTQETEDARTEGHRMQETEDARTVKPNAPQPGGPHYRGAGGYGAHPRAYQSNVKWRLSGAAVAHTGSFGHRRISGAFQGGPKQEPSLRNKPGIIKNRLKLVILLRTYTQNAVLCKNC